MVRYRDFFLDIFEDVAALPVGHVAAGLPGNIKKGNNKHQRARVI